MDDENLERERGLARDAERDGRGNTTMLLFIPPCPSDHEALKASPTLFAELRQLGSQKVRAGTLHFANCASCHSTLARLVRA